MQFLIDSTREDRSYLHASSILDHILNHELPFPISISVKSPIYHQLILADSSSLPSSLDLSSAPLVVKTGSSGSPILYGFEQQELLSRYSLSRVGSFLCLGNRHISLISPPMLTYQLHFKSRRCHTLVETLTDYASILAPGKAFFNARSTLYISPSSLPATCLIHSSLTFRSDHCNRLILQMSLLHNSFPVLESTYIEK
jgi:hypothetical protein